MFENKDELVGHSRRSHSELERRLHANSVRLREIRNNLATPSTDPDEEELPHRPLTNKNKCSPYHLPTQITSTSELITELTEDGPIIGIVETMGTPVDVDTRIQDQIQRISMTPSAQRTPVEQKYIHKKTS